MHPPGNLQRRKEGRQQARALLIEKGTPPDAERKLYPGLSRRARALKRFLFSPGAGRPGGGKGKGRALSNFNFNDGWVIMIMMMSKDLNRQHIGGIRQLKHDR